MNNVEKFVIAGRAFVASLARMVHCCIKSFVIRNDDVYFFLDLGDEYTHEHSSLENMPDSFKFGIRGYFVLNRNVMSLLRGFFSYFDYNYIELNTSSVKSSQMDDMLWFTVGKKTLKNSALEVIRFYTLAMEIEKAGGHFEYDSPICDPVTCIEFTDDESIGSTSRATIHVMLDEDKKKYFHHWVYARDIPDMKEKLVGMRLIDAVEYILSKVYDS